MAWPLTNSLSWFCLAWAIQKEFKFSMHTFVYLTWIGHLSASRPTRTWIEEENWRQIGHSPCLEIIYHGCRTQVWSIVWHRIVFSPKKAMNLPHPHQLRRHTKLRRYEISWPNKGKSILLGEVECRTHRGESSGVEKTRLKGRLRPEWWGPGKPIQGIWTWS